MTRQGDGVLVIGYGNALRTDDGFGWHAAGRLAADPRLDGAEILQLHQLTPELALDISRAGFAGVAVRHRRSSSRIAPSGPTSWRWMAISPRAWVEHDRHGS